MPASKVAAIFNQLAWLSVLVVAVAITVDLALGEPGRFYPVPRFLEPFLQWAPLVLSIAGIAFAFVSLMRGETEARRPRTWWAAVLIATVYALVAVCNQIWGIFTVV